MDGQGEEGMRSGEWRAGKNLRGRTRLSDAGRDPAVPEEPGGHRSDPTAAKGRAGSRRQQRLPAPGVVPRLIYRVTSTVRG